MAGIAFSGASHPWGAGSKRGYRPYSMMRTGLRPAGIGSMDGLTTSAVQGMIPGNEFTASGIFTPKAARFGSGIFENRWPIPRDVYEGGRYAGAQIVPGGQAFFHDALSGDDTGEVNWVKWGLAALAAWWLYRRYVHPVTREGIRSSAYAALRRGPVAGARFAQGWFGAIENPHRRRRYRRHR